MRTAEINDAKPIIDFRRHIAATSKYLTMQPDEIKDSRWKMKSQLKKYTDDPNGLYILAFIDNEIVGNIHTFGQTRRSLIHSFEFGIAVTPTWQGAGLGFILISELLNWAKENETLTRLQLHVHAENMGAIALYKKLGFVEEGRRRNAIRYEDGRYTDDLIMAQMV